MKRIIAILFVLVFALSLSTSALAEGGTIHIEVSPSTGGSCSVESGSLISSSADATATIKATPNPGYDFDHWELSPSGTEDATKNPNTFQVFERKITACFKEKEKAVITVAVADGQSSSGTVTGSGKYYVGERVTITATPSLGYEFDKWNDEVKEAARDVVVSSDITYFATFRPKKLTLSVVCEGSGYVSDSGGTSVSSVSREYSESARYISLQAKPSLGNKFKGWYGSDGTFISSDQNATVDMLQFNYLKAVFVSESAPSEPTSADPAPGPSSSDPSGGPGTGGPGTGGSGTTPSGPAPVDPGPAPVDPSLPGPPTPPGPYTEYTITYHPGAYGQGTPQAFTMAPGPGWLLGPTFTRSGYVQTGWSWYYDGKEKNADVFSVFAMPPKDIIVYPYWEPVKGPVTLSVGYSGSGAVQVNGRYVYNGEVFTLREGDSLTFGLYPSYGNYVYSVLLGNRYREVNTAYGYTITYDMLQGRNQTLLIRFESVYCRPKTGDDSNIALWAVLGACSVVCLGVLLVAKRKKK